MAKARSVYRNHSPSARTFIKRKFKGLSILGIYSVGIAIAMGTYMAPIPSEFFYLAYILVGAATVLALCKAWAYIPMWRWRWLIFGEIILIVLGIILGWEIRRIQIGRELLALNGVLIAANDPLLGHPSCLSQLPSTDLIAVLGDNLAVAAPTNRIKLVDIDRLLPNGSNDILWIDRNANGEIAVNAYVLDKEGKVVLEIDRNNFLINRNRIFDTLAPPRPDKSTVVIRDEEGNELKIRLMNRNTVFVRGKLYFLGDRYVDFGKDGVQIHAWDTPKSGKLDGFCLNMNQTTGGFIHLQKAASK